MVNNIRNIGKLGKQGLMVCIHNLYLKLELSSYVHMLTKRLERLDVIVIKYFQFCIFRNIRELQWFNDVYLYLIPQIRIDLARYWLTKRILVLPFLGLDFIVIKYYHAQTTFLETVRRRRLSLEIIIELTRRKRFYLSIYCKLLDCIVIKSYE